MTAAAAADRERERDTTRDQAVHQGTYVHDLTTDSSRTRWVIDARHMGGCARYINSSHEPNSVYE
eukprot:2122388-Rhodomonas_salina.1